MAPSYVALTPTLSPWGVKWLHLKVAYSSHDHIGKWVHYHNQTPTNMNAKFWGTGVYINITNACRHMYPGSRRLSDNKIKRIHINKGFTSCCWCVWSKVPAWRSDSSVWSCSLELQPNSTNWFYCPRQRAREKKATLWKIHSTLWWTSGNPLSQSSRAGGRENMPALIVYVGLGLHDRHGFSCPSHYSIKEELGFEDWPQHCHYRCTMQTYLSSVSNTPEISWGQTHKEGASHLMLLHVLPLYLFLIMMIIVLYIVCFFH